MAILVPPPAIAHDKVKILIEYETINCSPSWLILVFNYEAAYRVYQDTNAFNCALGEFYVECNGMERRMCLIIFISMLVLPYTKK